MTGVQKAYPFPTEKGKAKKLGRSPGLWFILLSAPSWKPSSGMADFIPIHSSGGCSGLSPLSLLSANTQIEYSVFRELIKTYSRLPNKFRKSKANPAKQIFLQAAGNKDNTETDVTPPG